MRIFEGVVNRLFGLRAAVVAGGIALALVSLPAVPSGEQAGGWLPRAPGLGQAAAQPFPSTADEVKLGASAAKSIESRYRLITDPVQVGRLNRIGESLARVVERQDLTYRFKIVAVPGVNAVSIPGGWIYVTAGMMRFVRSDDELAAVLAHELTHVNHRHYYIQSARQSRMLPALLVAAALSALARSPAPLIGAQISMRAVMNDYQRDLERDADLNGVVYLTHTAYSPVAMLTLMEHFAQEDRFVGKPDPTGLEDHPLPTERVQYVLEDLQQRHIPVVRRVPEGYLRVALDPPQPAAGAPVTVRVDGAPVMTFGAGANGLAPVDRALALAVRLDKFFNTDPAPFDVRAIAIGDRWSLLGGEVALFDLTPQDVAFAKTTAAALADDVRTRLARVIAAAPYNRKF